MFNKLIHMQYVKIRAPINAHIYLISIPCIHQRFIFKDWSSMVPRSRTSAKLTSTSIQILFQVQRRSHPGHTTKPSLTKYNLFHSDNTTLTLIYFSCTNITARAISYSFRDLSLLDIAYISCDIKEWQYSVLTSLRYVHLMQRGRKTIKIIWHSYIYSHFMPTCT